MGEQRNSRVALVRVVDLDLIQSADSFWGQPHYRVRLEAGKTNFILVYPACPTFIRRPLLVHSLCQNSRGWQFPTSPEFSIECRCVGYSPDGCQQRIICVLSRQNFLLPCQAPPRFGAVLIAMQRRRLGGTCRAEARRALPMKLGQRPKSRVQADSCPVVCSQIPAAYCMERMKVE